MPSLRPLHCPISGSSEARLVFDYDAPPPGEIGFRREASTPYRREVWQFTNSNHFVSCHAMRVATDYAGDYVDATYGDASGLTRTFERIIALPAAKSDNVGRFNRVRQFAETRNAERTRPRLLDVGAGLGVFPFAVKAAGWDCCAIDPDARAVKHMRERVGVEAVEGDFMTTAGIGRFDIVTLNKVLEHVTDPVAMLARTKGFLLEGGFVYIELPDGEMAARLGRGREEFFVEHLHVFSFASIVILANRAGFDPIVVERLQEPSSKFTLRAFLIPVDDRGTAE